MWIHSNIKYNPRSHKYLNLLNFICSMEDSGPAFPMFVQMNARLVEVDDQWRESSRWIKFQENVEDGCKRWSKPFVPSW